MRARAANEGPSGEGSSVSRVGGQPIAENVAATEERYDPEPLHAVTKKCNIDSTKSLVTAYNAATAEDERAALLEWLRKYHDRKADCLTPNAVLDYAELANIALRSTSEKDIVKDLIEDLTSCICEGNFLPPNFAAALCNALVHVDAFEYDGAEQLVVVARRLLGSLTREPKLTRKTFTKHEATFLALHHAFFLLRKANQNEIHKEEKQELRRTIAEKERTMKLSCEYYPVNFHFKALRQAAERLKDEDTTSRVEQTKQYVMCGLCGFVYVFHFVRNLARGDIDPTALEIAYERNRAAIDNMGVPKRPWFDWFRRLMAKRLEASEDDTKLGLFMSDFDAATESQQKMEKREDSKALKFGIIQEMRLLAKQTACEAVRKEATMKLLMLANNCALFEEWFEDKDIFTAFLDALHEIHITSDENQETTEAFGQIQQSCEGHARTTLRAWLGGDALEDKLETRDRQEAYAEHRKVFVKIARDAGHVPSDTIRSNIEELKDKYKHDFAKVSSLVNTEVKYHVKEMEHYVVFYEEIIERKTTEKIKDQVEEIEEEGKKAEGSSTQAKDHPKEHYEQKKKVTKPIFLEELFRPRSLKPGDPESEVRKVLLYGSPGSGKTCISKAIAHKWALGEIMQEFEVIYVVPIRRVNTAKSKGPQGVTLKDMVAQLYFGERSDVEYEDLLTQVENDLNSPTTLLMFDGLDEAGEDARELVHSAEERLCKLLILTRPYNLQQIRARVDCQFECLGFNNQQLTNYIHKELRQDEASRLIRSLQQDRGMWETAHTPVTAHILCSLSKQHGTSIENPERRASRFQIYNDMTNFVWKRFEERPEARIAKKESIFEDLEKVAFEALKNGQMLIEQRIVERCATSTNTSKFFKESGFLLLVLEGQEYQFPHLTFQEFFAGKYIAKGLKNKGSDAEEQALEFFRKAKYNEKHDLTVSFAMHAFAEGRSKFALREMLSIIDDDPVEVLGIQHFLLKMRVLESTIEEANEEDLRDILNDEQGIILAEGARQLLENTIKDTLIREIVVEKFQNLPCVLEQFSQVLNNVVNEAKTMLRCRHDLTQMEMEKIEHVLKLARHSTRQSDVIIQFVVLPSEEADGCCSSEECWRRLNSVIQQMPQHAREILQTLTNKCYDEDADMRRHAMETIGYVLEGAPHHASELPAALAKGCGDKESDVRRTAIDAISRIVAVAPHYTGELLQILEEKCGDKESDVRRTAIAAISRIVAVAPHYTGELLQILEEKCGDKESDVRRTAIEAISRIVAVAPHCAGELLTILGKKAGDEIPDVRFAAMEAIGRVVVAAPNHVNKFPPMLAKGCSDNESDVRQTAIDAFGRIVAALPYDAGVLLPILREKCNDLESDVRRAVMDAIGRILPVVPHYAGEILQILQEKCDDKDTGVCFAAIEAISRVSAKVPQHAGEILPTLTKKCDDDEADVRRMAINAISCLVGTASQHAGKILPTLTKKCDDDEAAVRSAAINAISRVVVAVPDDAGEVLVVLKERMEDKTSDVRFVAMEAIGRVLAAAPNHADELMPTLTKGGGNENSGVRRAVMEAIGRVVTAIPRHANKLVSTLTKGCCDEDWGVRRAVMEAIGRIVAGDSKHADKLMPRLMEGCGDQMSDVRLAAMEAISRIVATDPQLSGELIPMLTKGGGEYWGVRVAAIKAIGCVVAAKPEYAGKLMPTLVEKCGDEDLDVRSAARTVLNEMKPEEIISSLSSSWTDNSVP